MIFSLILMVFARCYFSDFGKCFSIRFRIRRENNIYSTKGGSCYSRNNIVGPPCCSFCRRRGRIVVSFFVAGKNCTTFCRLMLLERGRCSRKEYGPSVWHYGFWTSIFRSMTWCSSEAFAISMGQIHESDCSACELKLVHPDDILGVKCQMLF